MWMWRFSKVILLSPVLLRRRTEKIFHTHVAFNIDEPIIEDDPISSSDSEGDSPLRRSREERLVT